MRLYKRPSFSLQKVVFQAVKGGLSPCKGHLLHLRPLQAALPGVCREDIACGILSYYHLCTVCLAVAFYVYYHDTALAVKTDVGVLAVGLAAVKQGARRRSARDAVARLKAVYA